MSPRILSALVLAFLAITVPAAGAQTQPSRTILAIGAHAGDMELTAGQLLIKQRKKGDRVVILHMTLGEGGNPKLTPAAYVPRSGVRHSLSTPSSEQNQSLGRSATERSQMTKLQGFTWPT